MEEKLKQIISFYGLPHQLKYIHSEYFELDESILDYEKSGWDFSYEDCEYIEREYRNHIAEELSDIMVMLKQFQYYYGIEDKQIEDIMNFKIDRQLERIKNEDNK